MRHVCNAFVTSNIRWTSLELQAELYTIVQFSNSNRLAPSPSPMAPHSTSILHRYWSVHQKRSVQVTVVLSNKTPFFFADFPTNRMHIYIFFFLLGKPSCTKHPKKRSTKNYTPTNMLIVRKKNRDRGALWRNCRGSILRKLFTFKKGVKMTWNSFDPEAILLWTDGTTVHDCKVLRQIYYI